MYEENCVSVETEETDHQTTMASSDGDMRRSLQFALNQISAYQEQLQREEDSQYPYESDEEHDNIYDTDSDEADNDDDDDEFVNDAPLVDADDAVVMAGFQFCAKEALRFLVEDQQLQPDHPMVQQLTAHLSAQKQSLDCSQVFSDYVMNAP